MSIKAGAHTNKPTRHNNKTFFLFFFRHHPSSPSSTSLFCILTFAIPQRDTKAKGALSHSSPLSHTLTHSSPGRRVQHRRRPQAQGLTQAQTQERQNKRTSLNHCQDQTVGQTPSSPPRTITTTMGIPTTSRALLALGTALVLMCTTLVFVNNHNTNNTILDRSSHAMTHSHSASVSLISSPDDPSLQVQTSDSNNHDDHEWDHFEIDFKEPKTAPKSLPSDEYAQYIYQEIFPLPPGSKVPHLRPPARRTIVVGDIHGSIDGFNRFLVQTGYDHRRDSLILAGDLIAKGPRSLEVIDRAIKLGARCVRGNHDDKVIRWRGYLDSLTASEVAQLDNEADDNEDDDISIITDIKNINNDDINNLKQKKPRTPSDLDRRSEHYDIARRLNTRQYDYLRSCPLILTVPRELSVQNIPIHVVHAGIDPRKNILHQKPWVLVNVRNLLEDGTPSRTRKTGQSWAKAFNELHANTGRSRTSQEFLVVYGHDAGRSLNVKTWTIGLDSGCVYGRALSGYVIETGQIHTVPCPAHGGK